MAKDIPKATIAVLLVLTILVSIIGTWTVLESISIKESSSFEKGVGTTGGEVRLNIIEPIERKEDSSNIMFEIK